MGRRVVALGRFLSQSPALREVAHVGCDSFGLASSVAYYPKGDFS
jgi:hypothetical protein